MSAKKWLILFFFTVLVLALGIVGFNIVTDPFGAFGDPVMDWFSYDATNNPRVAKVSYLNTHFEDYDSYVLGCSSTSSYPVEALNRAYDAHFYNMIVYGADMLDTEEQCRWLLTHDKVSNLVLNVYIDNGLSYDYESNAYTDSMPPIGDRESALVHYARFAFASPEYGIAKLKARREDTYLAQTFDVFDPVTGTYDKRKRDAEPIGDLDSYFENYPVFTNYPSNPHSLPKITECMESVARIRDLCKAAGCNLIVATAPVYGDYLHTFPREQVEAFLSALAEVTDFWDFSYTPVSLEPRYFYDGTHFRNAIGERMVNAIMGKEAFGAYVTKDNIQAHLAQYWDVAPQPVEAQVQILTYHHLSEEETSSATISPTLFRDHLLALKEAGYQVVSLEALSDYVNSGVPLPEKALVLTFDDGYESNLSLAYPILQELGMPATIFVIGSSLGKSTYKDTGTPIYPHFDGDSVKQVLDLISLGSHTYDMHQSETLEEGQARTCVAPLAGETEAEFISAMRKDFSASRQQLTEITGTAPTALAYPTGISSVLTDAIAREAGFTVTLTSEPGVNTLVKGLPQSLLGLHRYSVGADWTPETLLDILRKQ